MPDMIPVGNTGAPIDPMRGLNTLSGILGIQQQRQALQTGAIQQQALDALRQQQELKTQEQTGLSQYIGAHDVANYMGNDGTLDANAYTGTPEFKNLPGNVKAAVQGWALQTKGTQLQNATTLQALDANTNQFVRSSLGSIANSDAAQKLEGSKGKDGIPNDLNSAVEVKQQIADMLKQWNGLNNPELSKVAATYGPNLNKLDAKHLVPALKALNAQALTAGERLPVVRPNAAGQLTTVEPTLGTLGTPPGATAQNNPASPTVAGQVARATGGADLDLKRADQVSAQIQPSSSAIPTTQRIDDLADQIASGKFKQYVINAAAAVGSKDYLATAQQLLRKDLGNIKTQAQAVGGTDQKMATILSAYPEETSTPQTIHTAMDYIRGNFRQNVARGQLLTQYREKVPDLSGFQHADDTLTLRTDPYMHEFESLKTPQERSAFYKRNFANPDQAQDFRNRVTAAEHLNVLRSQ